MVLFPSQRWVRCLPWQSLKMEGEGTGTRYSKYPRSNRNRQLSPVGVLHRGEDILQTTYFLYTGLLNRVFSIYHYMRSFKPSEEVIPIATSPHLDSTTVDNHGVLGYKQGSRPSHKWSVHQIACDHFHLQIWRCAFRSRRKAPHQNGKSVSLSHCFTTISQSH